MTVGPASLAAGPCPSCGSQGRPDPHSCPEPAPWQVAVSGEGAVRATACAFCRAAQISPDGYCDSCGRKVPSNRDHSELDLGRLAGVTDRGLRRHRNEDAMALATADLASGPVAAAVVCDGVSGAPRPDEAAQVAARSAIQVLLAELGGGADPVAACRDAVGHAQEALAGLVGPARPGGEEPAGEALPPGAPASTLVGAVITGGTVTLCWLGDSRGYWLDGGALTAAGRLTRDDSVAADMIEAGDVSEAEALASPQAHVMTRWIGADLPGEPPHVARFSPPGPGALLLCSDGLWNYQPEAAELARLALPEALADPLGASATLVQFALDAGGVDNVTVVLVPFPLARAAAEPCGQPPAPSA